MDYVDAARSRCEVSGGWAAANRTESSNICLPPDGQAKERRSVSSKV